MYYIESRLSEEHKTNLARLATYLESLPRLYREFDMTNYFNNTGNHLDVHYALYNGTVARCGTSACAVGHGPSAGIFLNEDEIINNFIAWGSFEDRVFTGGQLAAYEFLFTGRWDEVDNHHWGAAARIRYVLDTNQFPDTTDVILKDVALLYKSYRIKKCKPLPKDFYTPYMLARFAKGESLLANI